MEEIGDGAEQGATNQVSSDQPAVIIICTLSLLPFLVLTFVTNPSREQEICSVDVQNASIILIS